MPFHPTNREGDCEMVKTRRKITALRVLQVLFYALGFPLFVHLVLLASSSYRDSFFVSGFGAWKPVIYAAVLWAVVILAQLLFRAVCRKNRMARSVLVALVAAVITVGPIMYCDFILKNDYEADAAAALEKGVEIPSYESAITSFDEYVATTNSEIQQFIDVFYLETFGSRNYNKGGNTDGTLSGGPDAEAPYNELPYTIEVEYDEENDIYYSPNGMFVDGYRFGYYAAKQVLTDYYSNKLNYEPRNKDDNIDVYLGEVLAELEANPNSDWNKYKRGAAESSFAMEDFHYIYSSSEYDNAYGENGTANKYFLTRERVDEIIEVLAGALASQSTLINDIINSLNFFVSGPEFEMIIGLVKGLMADIGSLDTDKLLDILNDTVITTEGGEQTLAELVFGLLGMEVDGELTWETLQEILASSAISVYISPSTYPIYYFIEDEGLKDYAYAKYYATVHGAKLGSVLVDESPKNGVEYVGHVTMSSSGTINPYTGAELLSLFEKWDTEEEIQGKYYPFFIVRSTLIKMSAVIVFTLIAAYYFTSLIDKQYAKLTLKAEGGRI